MAPPDQRDIAGHRRLRLYGTRIVAASSDGHLAILRSKDGTVEETFYLNDSSKPGSGLDSPRHWSPKDESSSAPRRAASPV